MVGQVSPMLLVISVTCSDPISAQVNTVVQPVILSLALGLHLAGTGFEAHSFFHRESLHSRLCLWDQRSTLNLQEPLQTPHKGDLKQDCSSSSLLSPGWVIASAKRRSQDRWVNQGEWGL